VSDPVVIPGDLADSSAVLHESPNRPQIAPKSDWFQEGDAGCSLIRRTLAL